MRIIFELIEPGSKVLDLGCGSGEKHKKALVGGTLAANPLSCVAGYYTICEMEKTGASRKAGLMGDCLTAGLLKLIEDSHPKRSNSFLP